jgi:uncharacterized membrane protein
MELYSDKLIIIGINVSMPEGQELYKAAVQRFNIPENRIGVPSLVVKDIVLVGSYEIPSKFPNIIEAGLANGGIDWPDIPGLIDIISEEESASQTVNHLAGTRVLESNTPKLTTIQKLALDPIGNTLAVIVLFGMLASIIGVGYHLYNYRSTEVYSWPFWFIPAITVIGLGVAGYLSYIEVTHSEAFCGPIGNCNSVQQSPYAVLFDFLPIGVLGVVGYILILIAWLTQNYGSSYLRKPAGFVLWIMAFFGVLFSICLTFLEPFVIGATCAWCLTSAIIITLILWAATGPLKSVLKSSFDHISPDNT